ncbi:MAG: hypothetical protein ACREXO_19260, partial [Advenella sp.]
ARPLQRAIPCDLQVPNDTGLAVFLLLGSSCFSFALLPKRTLADCRKTPFTHARTCYRLGKSRT